MQASASGFQQTLVPFKSLYKQIYHESFGIVCHIWPLVAKAAKFVIVVWFVGWSMQRSFVGCKARELSLLFIHSWLSGWIWSTWVQQDV